MASVIVLGAVEELDPEHVEIAIAPRDSEALEPTGRRLLVKQRVPNSVYNAKAYLEPNREDATADL